jgi:glutaminase
MRNFIYQANIVILKIVSGKFNDIHQGLLILHLKLKVFLFHQKAHNKHFYKHLGRMDFQEIINRIYHEVKPLTAYGKVADYIPALKQVFPDNLGISIQTLDRKSYCKGECDIPFSVQSISKVFGLTIAYRNLGSKLWERMGKEPSGTYFNSLVQLEHEQGIPRNPFINAGALVVSDIILSCCNDPYNELINFVREACDDPNVDYNKTVADSEKETGDRNFALAYFMKSYGNIKNPVEDVLNFYFMQCSIEMDCRNLARSFLYLVNHGTNPYNNKMILNASQTKRISALMITSGMYNEAGDFAYRVGLPGKSGVGGGIVAFIPQKLSIAVWSPALNKSGNSLAGIEALERFTTYTGDSVF